MKKLIYITVFAIFCAIINGCKIEEQTYSQTTTKSSMSSSFNQETYVWESFLFPTNRTLGRQ